MGYLLAALLGGFFLFNGAASPEKAAHLAQEALQKQYPTAQVNVEIEGKSGVSVLKGNFKRVHIGLVNATVKDLPFSSEPTSSPDGKPSKPPKLAKAGKLEVEMTNLTWGTLPVRRARFDFSDVRYDFGALKKTSEFRIAKMGPAQMQLSLSTDSLQPEFASRLKDIEDLQVGVEGDHFKLTGSRDVVGLKTPLELNAHLVGVGNTLRLEEPKLLLGGVTLPDLATKALVKNVNPIYTFDKEGKWPFNVQLNGVNGQGNNLDLTAALVLK